MGNASLDEKSPIYPILPILPICHFLKQVDYFSLVYESKEDSC